MSNPILHGPAFSTYTRSVRITLAEKGVAYDLREINFMEGWPEGYERLHPFTKVPAFEHDDLILYETPAIMAYINSAFDGPALLPEQPALRAKSIQAINVVDNYTYDPVITRTFVQRALAPMLGGATDEKMIEDAQEECERAFAALNALLDGQDYFGGENVSLADFHVVPIMHYASQIPEGQSLIGNAPAIGPWLDRMNTRDSVSSTIPSMG